MTMLSFFTKILTVLGLVLAIPPYTCIVIVNLEILRKKGKLSPSDVIFLTKAIVNVLLLCVLSFYGILSGWYPSILQKEDIYMFLQVSGYFMMYFTFWLTAWLSVHYWTSITNLSSGFFIWIKRVVFCYLGQILVLTALGLVPVTVLNLWGINVNHGMQSHENSTDNVSFVHLHFHIKYFYFIPATALGSILPFCLSLLCLLLTVSFLARHVWRVKNNDSGSTRPNLQAHVTALRTITFLLFMFCFFFISQVILFIINNQKTTDPIIAVSWALLSFSTSAEAAIIFQASTKLRRNLLRRLWTRSLWNLKT